MNPVWNLRELSTFKTENLWIFGYLVMFRELRDLIIEGLSLARTQKEEFSSIIESNDGDINALFDKLKEFINS